MPDELMMEPGKALRVDVRVRLAITPDRATIPVQVLETAAREAVRTALAHSELSSLHAGIVCPGGALTSIKLGPVEIPQEPDEDITTLIRHWLAGRQSRVIDTLSQMHPCAAAHFCTALLTHYGISPNRDWSLCASALAQVSNMLTDHKTADNRERFSL